jgi:hypothetical protein
MRLFGVLRVCGCGVTPPPHTPYTPLRGIMNYNSKKDAELKDLAEARGLNVDDFINGNGHLNRKAISDALRAGDIANKVPIDVVVEADDLGNVESLETISEKAVQIVFYSMEENDMPYVQLGLNGKALYVPKEVEVWIPHKYVEGCLRNAIMDKMQMDINHKGDINYRIKKVPRFSYNILDIKTYDELKQIAKDNANKE